MNVVSYNVAQSITRSREMGSDLGFVESEKGFEYAVHHVGRV